MKQLTIRMLIFSIMLVITGLSSPCLAQTSPPKYMFNSLNNGDTLKTQQITISEVSNSIFQNLMFNLKKVFGMSNTQSVTLYVQQPIAANQATPAKFYMYDDPYQLSHRAVNIKKIVYSVGSESESVEILSAFGFINYTGRKMYYDPANAGVNTYLFDTKKEHNVTLYVGEGEFNALLACLVAKNVSVAVQFIQMSIYIEFEVL